MNKGQSMFEVVIALFIIAMIIVGVVSLTTVSVSNSFFKNKTLAGKYSQEAIEWLRSQTKADFTTFKTSASGTRCLKTLAFSLPLVKFQTPYLKDKLLLLPYQIPP